MTTLRTKYTWAGIWLLTILVPTSPALSSQHLVAPGDNWENLAERIRPGDEVILMPGRHREAAFDRLVGTREKPIIIRAASNEQPTTIFSEREGIRIRQAGFLEIRDLEIVGAKFNGIAISSGPAETGKPKATGRVRIHNVTVRETGPQGLRHGVLLEGLTDVLIDSCRIEAWGGAGIELVACTNVTIERCVFKGADGFSQQCGVRARAGSMSVKVNSSRFENPGAQAVVFGGASKSEEFRIETPAGGTPPSYPAEARHCAVDQSLFLNCAQPVTFLCADDCLVRNNTFIRPRGVVFQLGINNESPSQSKNKRNLFGYNITVWQAGDLKTLTDVHAAADSASFVLEENLWWGGENGEEFQKLGALPWDGNFPQFTDVDPKLNNHWQPTAPNLTAFGAQDAVFAEAESQ